MIPGDQINGHASGGFSRLYFLNRFIILITGRKSKEVFMGKASGRTVAIGIQDFGDLIRKGYFYIDKTEFIREWWDRGDSVTLITHPSPQVWKDTQYEYAGIFFFTCSQEGSLAF